MTDEEISRLTNLGYVFARSPLFNLVNITYGIFENIDEPYSLDTFNDWFNELLDLGLELIFHDKITHKNYAINISSLKLINIVKHDNINILGEPNYKIFGKFTTSLVGEIEIDKEMYSKYMSQRMLFTLKYGDKVDAFDGYSIDGDSEVVTPLHAASVANNVTFNDYCSFTNMMALSDILLEYAFGNILNRCNTVINYEDYADVYLSSEDLLQGSLLICNSINRLAEGFNIRNDAKKTGRALVVKPYVDFGVKEISEKEKNLVSPGYEGKLFKMKKYEPPTVGYEDIGVLTYQI